MCFCHFGDDLTKKDVNAYASRSSSWNYHGDAFVFGFSLAPSVLVAGPFHGLSMKHERASAEKVWLVLRRRCWSEILLGVVIGQASMCVFPRFPVEIN